MSAVINDYEQLRGFVNCLQNYLQQIDNANSGLDQAFSELGDVWRDQQRTDFEEVYNQLRDMLKKFHDSTEQQIPYLLDLANILEQYSSRRTRI